MRYALLRHSGVGAASCRCWFAPIECGPSAACTGELVTRLMCLVCAGTVAAALERMAQPDATEWLYWFWCKPPIGYRQHGLGRELSQLQARSCRRCEHRYRRKWLYLRRACAVPMPRCAAGSQQRRRGDKRAAAAATCSTPQSARQARCCCYMQHTLAWCSRQTSELPCVPCEVLSCLLSSERCGQMQCSGSSFDAGRSGIASTDSDGS